MQTQIKSLIQNSIATKELVLEDEQLLQTLQECVQTVLQCFKNGNKVWFCGNGGSAADAQHLSAEFSGRFYLNRKALPSEALHVNSSFITAVANDFGYEQVYARMLDGIGSAGDVLIGLSTSGNSPNIINAFETARKKNIVTIGFTGSTGGGLKALSDHLINIPSSVTPRIQESHILLGHILCELVEAKYFENDHQ